MAEQSISQKIKEQIQASMSGMADLKHKTAMDAKKLETLNPNSTEYQTLRSQIRADDVSLRNMDNNPEVNKLREMQTGAQFGENVLGDGLGRAAGNADIESLRGQYNQMAQGYSGAEATARQEQAYQGINQATQTASRALQASLAKAGVRGGMAGSQLRDVQVQGMQQKANTQRDLFIAGEEAKRTGVNQLADFTTGILKYDQDQSAKEKDLVLQSAMGFAGMGVAERGASAAASASAAAAAAQKSCFVDGSMVEMEGGAKKNISTLKIGDLTALGGRVTATGVMEVDTELFKFNNSVATATHVIFEEGQWITLGDSKYAVSLGLHKTLVYPLNVENNIYLVDNRIHRNFTECEGAYDQEDALNKLNNDFSELTCLSVLESTLQATMPYSKPYSNLEIGHGREELSVPSRIWRFVTKYWSEPVVFSGDSGRI